MLAEIKSLNDVAEFVLQLLAEGLNYHADDDFANYINYSNGRTVLYPAGSAGQKSAE